MRTQLTNMDHLGKISKPYFIALIALVCALSPIFSHRAAAFDGSSFNPGYIISDEQFYDGYSLSNAAIQEWLNAQVPVCDTNGTGDSGHGMDRASWGAQNGAPAPYTCLKDYGLTHGPVAADQYCGAIGGGTKSAATIIMDIGRACNISPKVILVLLQKEQSLVTDDWPWPIQYTSATGYYCPDSPLAPAVDQNGNNCHDAYEGFFNQVYYGARQFQLYRVNADQYNFRAGRNQHILYHPNTACGSSAVFIQNQATASLYNYTPYQPNQAALNDLYGSGDLTDPADPNCSSFGNRNFWRMFYNWWGDPAAGCQNSSYNTQVLRLYDPKTYNHLYTNDYCEANKMKAEYGFILEGPVFNVANGVPDAVTIYRMYNSRTGLHHYVTNQQEINDAIPAGYHYEGPAFSVAPSSQTGAFPVYRMYNPRTYIHLWVTSQADIDAAVPAGYHYEGIAWYAT